MRNISVENHMDKRTLDDILEKHKAQPVGHGYIDIIVSRDNYKSLVSDLVSHDFKISSVSWWEWCPDKKESEHGLGGPESVYFNGWFSEIPVDVDDFSFSPDNTNADTIKEVVNKIETKAISFSHETVAFNQSSWLTPALWLEVPNDWRNTYST
jgi:hypothetical protein